MTVSAVRVPVLLSRTCSSANHGLLLATAPVAVTAPPVDPLAIVSATAAVRVVKPVAAAEIVTLAVPSVADAPAVNVTTVELPVVDAGLADAVTPLGRPDTVNATEPVKPPVRVTVHVTAPFALRFTVSVAGHAKV